MRDIGRPEMLRAKPGDASGGGESSDESLGIAGLPQSKEHEYGYEMLRAIRDDMRSTEGKERPEDAFGRFMDYASRYVENKNFPRNLIAIAEVGRSLDEILEPITKAEQEKINKLRKNAKREWNDRSPLKPEEGALLSEEQRKKIKEVQGKIRSKGWDSYSQEAMKAGIKDTTQMPQSMDKLFLAYVVAVRDFYPGTPKEQLERLDECAQKMLDEDPPQNELVRWDLVQKFGDAMKMHLDLLTGKGSDERTQLWRQANRKLGGWL